MIRNVLTGLCFILLIGCAAQSSNHSQGIEGQVSWVSGNRMPGPETNLPDPEPVIRWIIITRVVTADRLPDLADGLYPTLPVEAVDSVKSDKSGKFRIGLAPGEYSVFTKEDGGYFANSFNSENQVTPVTVRENEYSPIKIEINYKAVY